MVASPALPVFSSSLCGAAAAARPTVHVAAVAQQQRSSSVAAAAAALHVSSLACAAQQQSPAVHVRTQRKVASSTSSQAIAIPDLCWCMVPLCARSVKLASAVQQVAAAGAASPGMCPVGLKWGWLDAFVIFVQ